jgi:ribosomal-protein-alanine N-acetyltransferase
MIERLRSEHRDALLAFERENREYFAASVPDRGDDYFTHFDDHLQARLDEQDTGACHFHVVIEHGELLGRVNLIDVADGSADLGFRVAAKATGRGMATAAVREVCVLAREVYGLTGLRAAAAVDNVGSRSVLARTGFTPTGEDVTLAGKPGHRFHLRLGVTHTP